jgi:putative ABC transport system ATP-binding protein
MSLIEARDLKKDYINEDLVTPVLRGVSFGINKGEFVSIMGPSGSGKSTLMHILGFLDTLTSGQYLFQDKDVSTLTDDELARARRGSVGFVFQAFNLLPRLSAVENVTLPLVYTHVPAEERKKRAIKLLESVGLGHRLENRPNQLSGGEKQRVAIARALINDPEIIFADEPTGNLDSKSGLAVMKILQQLNRDGHTIVLVTHERYTAEYAARIIQLKDGVIIADEKTKQRQLADEQTELLK